MTEEETLGATASRSLAVKEQAWAKETATGVLTVVGTSEEDPPGITNLARAYLALLDERSDREGELNLARGVLSNFQTDKQGYCQACGKADPRDEGHNENCIIGHVLADWPDSPAPGLAGGFSQTSHRNSGDAQDPQSVPAHQPDASEEDE